MRSKRIKITVNLTFPDTREMEEMWPQAIKHLGGLDWFIAQQVEDGARFAFKGMGVPVILNCEPSE